MKYDCIAVLNDDNTLTKIKINSCKKEYDFVLYNTELKSASVDKKDLEMNLKVHTIIKDLENRQDNGDRYYSRRFNKLINHIDRQPYNCRKSNYISKTTIRNIRKYVKKYGNIKVKYIVNDNLSMEVHLDIDMDNLENRLYLYDSKSKQKILLSEYIALQRMICTEFIGVHDRYVNTSDQLGVYTILLDRENISKYVLYKENIELIKSSNKNFIVSYFKGIWDY